MRRFLTALLPPLVLLGSELGCQSPGHNPRASSKPALPTNARPMNAAGLSEMQLIQAAKLCATKCVRCHQLYDPAAYTDA